MMGIASISPIIAWPWHLRFLGHPGWDVGGSCIDCRRAVAVPGPCRPVCIYCGMGRGLVETIDKPIQ